jgi:hypothetical protein
MVDFNFKSGSFPIAEVIQAAQRKAQLEQQAKTQDNEQVVQGLGAIGSVGKSLVDQRLKVARSLALGKQFGIPDDQARLMEPDDILRTAAVNKGGVDMQMLFALLHPGAAAAQAGINNPAGATPASQSTPVPNATNGGAILASNTTATPIPITSSVQPTPAMSVPIPAPPIKPPMVNKATADMAYKLSVANKPEAVISQKDALAAGSVSKGTHIINANNSDSDNKEQERLYRDAVAHISSLRGDPSLKATETQRDAAISAYNRLNQISAAGKTPNPVDYVDIVGQIYKARTGVAPTDIVLKHALQETAHGKWGEAMTFLTGTQQSATTGNIADSLKEMVLHMGQQADELHDGYWTAHGEGVFDPNLSPDRAARLAKVTHGKSFAEATNYKKDLEAVHDQALDWANSHPDDPRAKAIIQKATAAKGQTIGI